MSEKNNISKDGHDLQIHNSTVDFPVFTRDEKEDGIEVRVQDHDLWLTQKAIGRLFDVERSIVTKHLKNIFEGEVLTEDSVCEKLHKLQMTEKRISKGISIMSCDYSEKIFVRNQKNPRLPAFQADERRD